MKTFNGVMNAATRTAGSGGDLVLAAGQIVARRIALGVAAAFNPMDADHAELGRMVPEKVEAFSAAGMIVLEQSNQAGWHLTRLASHEVFTTAHATVSMAGCINPAVMAEEQGRFACAWLDRIAQNFFAMGLLALGAQEAAMVPIRQAVAANVERLGRS
jgi:hypothetical protein